MVENSIVAAEVSHYMLVQCPRCNMSFFPASSVRCHLCFLPVQTMAEKAPSEKAPSVVSSTPSRSWKGWLWDSADVSKEERRFLLKVGHE
jgi:hypothetical protein